VDGNADEPLSPGSSVSSSLPGTRPASARDRWHGWRECRKRSCLASNTWTPLTDYPLWTWRRLRQLSDASSEPISTRPASRSETRGIRCSSGFRSVLSDAWRVAAEVPLPTLGDRRSWDLLLRMPGQLIGIEAETRLRDIQGFVRRVREREREGGANTILIVLAESAHNRRVLPQLLEALGPRYSTSARVLLKALREGKPLAGSGVVLI
jgi:hypothetical protein